MREYFCAYHSMLAGTRKLSDAECGRLFRALLRYSSGEDVELINLQGREEVLFDVYSQQIDRDIQAYEASVMRSRENGSKGGRPRKNPENPAGFSETQKTQDKDKEKGKDKGKDKDDISKERFNDHWRTSVRARASVAQQLIDELEKAFGKCEYSIMHDALCDAMNGGISPETILEGVPFSRNWSELAAWIAWRTMKGVNP